MAPFGLTAAEDQQMAGLLMWIPGGLVHAGAALVLVLKALRLNGAPAQSAQASNAVVGDPRADHSLRHPQRG
jgi:cytochrome c oxidase assembly factor CtaG